MIAVPSPLMVWSLALLALAVGLRARRRERGPAERPDVPFPIHLARVVPVHPALLTHAMSERIRVGLVAAGLAPRVSPMHLAHARLALAQAGLAGGAVLAVASVRAGIATGVVLAAAGYLGPVRWITLRAHRRRGQILRELPDLIDLVVICTESGMALDPAIRVAAERLPGELATEITYTLRELDLGTPRRDAYAGLSDRLGVAQLTSLVGALLQAEELGVPIAGVLRRQAALLRAARTQDMRDHAARAAPKVQLVVALVMVPAALLVILGVLVIELAGQIGGVVGGAT